LHVCHEKTEKYEMSPVRRWCLLFIAFFSVNWLAHAQPWTPDLETLEGRLAWMQSMLERHPNLVTSNLQFRRNLLRILQDIPEIRESLGVNAAPNTINKTTRLSHTYVTGGEWTYDDSKINTFKEQIIKNLEFLKITTLKDMPTDFAALKAADNNQEDAFRKSAKNYFQLMPFLYNDQGQALVKELNDEGRKKLTEKIRSATPAQLKGFYGDFMSEHLAEKVEVAAKVKGLGGLTAYFQNFRQVFIERPEATVRITFKPLPKSEAELSSRTLSLELLPPEAAIFRGCFGGDCSLGTIPFYPLIEGVKVYAIRKSKNFDAPPNGYILVVGAEVNGKKIPYVITVNGALSSDDVKAAVRMVKHDWGTDLVIVPDLAKNGSIVNTPEMSAGLKYSRAKRVEVILPAGWDVVDKKSHGYYSRESLQNAYLVRPDQGEAAYEIKKEIVDSPYRKAPPTETLNLLNRAVLAAQASYKEGDEKLNTVAIRKHLQVSDKQVAAASHLANALPSNPLRHSGFLDLQKEFDFQFADINKMDIVTAAHSLAALHKEEPKLVSEDVWKETVMKNFDNLSEAIVQAADHAEALRLAIRAQLTLPLPYRPSDEEILGKIIANLSSDSEAARVAGINSLKEFRANILEDTFVKIETLMADSSAKVRLAALEFLSLDPVRPTIAEKTEKLLQDPVAELRAKALEKLAKWYEHNPRLDSIAQHLLSDPAENVRAGAVEIFLKRPNHTQSIVALLAPNLSLSDSGIRTRVGDLISRAKISDPRIQNDVELLLSDPNPGVRASALRVIPNFVIVTDELKAKTVAALDDIDLGVKRQAAAAVNSLKLNYQEDVRANMIPMLAHPDKDTRQVFKNNLHATHLETADEFIRVLELYRENKDPGVRKNLSEFLNHRWRGIEGLELRARAYLSDPDQDLVGLIINLYSDSNIERTPEALQLIKERARDGSPDIRARAYTAMSHFRPLVAEDQKVIARGISDRSPTVKLAAIKAARRLGSSENVYPSLPEERYADRRLIPVEDEIYKKLADLSQDWDISVRDEANSALTELKQDRRDDRGRIYEHVDRAVKKSAAKPLPTKVTNEEQTQFDNHGLDRQNDHAKAYAARDFFSNARNLSPGMQSKLIGLLPKFATSEKAQGFSSDEIAAALGHHNVTSPLLHEQAAAFLSDSNARVRQAAAQILGAMKNVDPEISARMAPGLKDKDPNVRQASMRALAAHSRLDKYFDDVIASIDSSDSALRHVARNYASVDKLQTFDQFDAVVDIYRRTKNKEIRSELERYFKHNMHYSPLRDSIGTHAMKYLNDENEDVSMLFSNLYGSQTFSLNAQDGILLAPYVQDANETKRLNAIKALGNINRYGDVAQLALAEALADPSKTVRVAALAAMKGMAEDAHQLRTHPDVYRYLVPATQESDAAIRGPADKLLAALIQRDPADREIAAKYLAQGSAAIAETPSALASEESHFQNLSISDYKQREKKEAAKAFFHESTTLSDAVLLKWIALLPAIAHGTNKEKENRGMSTYEFTEMLKRNDVRSAKVHDAIAAYLNHADPVARNFAITCLGVLPNLDDKITAQFTKMLDDVDPKVREHAIDAIEKLETEGNHSAKFISMMVDTDKNVRQKARHAWNASNDLRDVDEFNSVVKLFRDYQDSTIREELKTYLENYRPDDEHKEQYQEQVRSLLHDGDPAMVELSAALYANGNIKITEVDRPRILELQSNPREETRRLAGKTINRIGRAQEHEQLLFSAGLRDQSAKIRMKTLESIEKYAGHNFEQNRKLVKGWIESEQVKIYIDPRLPAHVVELLSDEDGDIRKKSAELLDNFSESEPSLAPEIKKLISAKRARMAAGDQNARFPSAGEAPSGELTIEKLPLLFAHGPAAIDARLEEVMPFIACSDGRIRAKIAEHMHNKKEFTENEEVLLTQVLILHPDQVEPGFSLLRKRKIKSQAALVNLVQLSPKLHRPYEGLDIVAKSSPLGHEPLSALLELHHRGVDDVSYRISECTARDLDAQKVLIDMMATGDSRFASYAFRALENSNPDREGLREYTQQQRSKIPLWNRNELLKFLGLTSLHGGDWPPLVQKMIAGDEDAFRVLYESSQGLVGDNREYEKALIEAIKSPDITTSSRAASLLHLFSKLSPEGRAQLRRVEKSTTRYSSGTRALCRDLLRGPKK
jgi:hypothetical protein